MNSEEYNTEIIIDEFDTASLPSLEDLMQEFAAEEASEKPVSAGGIYVISETEESSLEVFQPVESNNDELERLNQELAASLRRVQADFDNYRRRVERERNEHYSYAVSTVIRELLPVIDNFGRALTNAETYTEETSTAADLQHFFDGFHLIQKQLDKVLAVLGVQPIPALGKPFDPHVHEAVAIAKHDEFPPNTIIEELMRGYRLGEKLIRPSLVKVST